MTYQPRGMGVEWKVDLMFWGQADRIIVSKDLSVNKITLFQKLRWFNPTAELKPEVTGETQGFLRVRSLTALEQIEHQQ